MSTDAKTPESNASPVAPPISMRELTRLLVKHYGLTEGTYSLLVEYQIGTGGVGPDKDNLLPGAMIGVARVGLVPAAANGPNSVDASAVNSKKPPRKKTTTT